jgi:hypothetical protein
MNAGRFALLFALFTFGAHAQDFPIKYMANIKGKCTHAEVNGVDKTAQCKPHVVNVGYNTNRMMFMFVAPSMITFSGETATLPRYAGPALKVTVVNVEDVGRLEAKGSCIAEPQTDGMRFSCSASTVSGPQWSASFVFEAQQGPLITGNGS